MALSQHHRGDRPPTPARCPTPRPPAPAGLPAAQTEDHRLPWQQALPRPNRVSQPVMIAAAAPVRGLRLGREPPSGDQRLDYLAEVEPGAFPPRPGVQLRHPHQLNEDLVVAIVLAAGPASGKPCRLCGQPGLDQEAASGRCADEQRPPDGRGAFPHTEQPVTAHQSSGGRPRSGIADAQP
jgi:hypothetical protein